MQKFLMTLSAGAALTLAALAPAQAQQGQPTQPEAGQPTKGMIAPQSLSQDQVRLVQSALTARGIYKGPINGVWGPETAAAVRQFRAQQGGPQGTRPDGDQIDAQTLSALGVEPPQPLPPGRATRGSPSAPEGRRGTPSGPPAVRPGAPPSSTQPGAPG